MVREDGHDREETGFQRDPSVLGGIFIDNESTGFTGSWVGLPCRLVPCPVDEDRSRLSKGRRAKVEGRRSKVKGQRSGRGVYPAADSHLQRIKAGVIGTVTPSSSRLPSAP